MPEDDRGPEPDVGTAANRYRHLIEHIQDAVVEFELADGEPVVTDANGAFVDVFGYERADLVGTRLNEWIVPDWLSAQARELDERTASGEINHRRVTRETDAGLREFLYRGVPYPDGATEAGGFAVYTDLTEIVRNERRLQVMNRVLRHNLRNKANVVGAYTTQLLDEFDEQSPRRTEVAATIERAAHDLETLAAEAKDIRAVVEGADVGEQTVDLVPLVRDVARRYRETNPAATVETTLPDSARVTADHRLGVAVESLVDNAIEHNPADDPWVRIRVTEDDADGWVRLAVDDDGPRIPADERSVIAGDADITPTRHGTGLGLWLVKWTAETYGGELSFATSEFGGNSVRIRLLER